MMRVTCKVAMEVRPPITKAKIKFIAPFVAEEIREYLVRAALKRMKRIRAIRKKG